MSDSEASEDGRLAELKDWLNDIDAVSGTDLLPASDDASFRRYFRLQKGRKSFIAMDAPPPQEDCLPYIRIAGYLEAMQLNTPRIIEADPERGFLLLSDLGATQYLERLRDKADSCDELYTDAIAALHTIQERGIAYQALLPPYDAELLVFELSLFRDWLCATHIEMQFSSKDELEWRNICSLLTRNALDQPQVFVHRDYHSRNLMLSPGNNPGILDFQDAVEGPLTYDLVSLLKDCYIALPETSVRGWAETFYASLDESMHEQLGPEQFKRYFELMGVHRHLKAAGIFARLNHRDGKTEYLEDIPRTLAYIVELAPRYDELEFLVELITDRVLPASGDDA